MNFGFISSFINIKLFNSVIIFNNFIFLIYILKNLGNKKTLLILSVLLIFILIMSFTHSAQRYLLVLVPLIYIFFVSSYNNKNDYFFILITYIVLNVLIFGNLFNNHKTISKTIDFLKEENLIGITNPGYIGQHALNNFTEFYKNDQKIEKQEIFDNKNYIVKDNVKNNETIVFKVTSNFLFIKKKLFVIKN